jgi:hypothetical protein
LLAPCGLCPSASPPTRNTLLLLLSLLLMLLLLLLLPILLLPLLPHFILEPCCLHTANANRSLLA